MTSVDFFKFDCHKQVARSSNWPNHTTLNHEDAIKSKLSDYFTTHGLYKLICDKITQ